MPFPIENNENTFYYLATLSDKEIKELCDILSNAEHQITAQELEQELANNKIWFWARYTCLIMTLGTNFIYLKFQVDISNAGIENLIRFFSEKAKMPKAFNALTITAAACDSILYSLVFTPKKLAVQLTAESIYGPSTKASLRSLATNLQTQTLSTSIKIFQYLINITIKLICGASASMTEVLPIYPLLPNHLLLKILSVTAILSLGSYYQELFFGPDYDKGYEWWQDKDRPWLIERIKEGEIAIPLQIILQGLIGGAFLRAIPYYLNLARLSKNMLGWWINENIVVLAILYQSLLAIYPSIYDAMMNPQVEIKKLLKKEFNNDDKIKLFLTTLGIELDEENFKKNRADYLKAMVESAFQTALSMTKSQMDISYVWKAHNILHSIARSGIGGFIGYTVLQPIFEPYLGYYASAVASIMLGGLALELPLLASQYELKAQQETYERLQFQKNEKQTVKLPIEIAAATFTIGNLISQGLAYIGSLDNKQGNTAIGVTAALTLESIIAAAQYVSRHTKETLQTFTTNISSFTSKFFGLFSGNADDVQVEDIKISDPICRI